MITIQKQVDILGGLCELYCIPVRNIKILQGGQIIIYDTNNCYQFECVLDSIEHTCPSKEEKAGTVFQHKITAQVHGITEETSERLLKLKRDKHLILYKNYQGLYFHVGDKEIGLQFSFEENTTMNTYSIQFSGDLLYTRKPGSIPIYVP